MQLLIALTVVMIGPIYAIVAILNQLSGLTQALIFVLVFLFFTLWELLKKPLDRSNERE